MSTGTQNNWQQTGVRSYGFPQLLIGGMIGAILIIVAVSVINNWKSAKTETPTAEMALVTAVDQLGDSWEATEKARKELKKITVSVSKENQELRKEIEVLKKKIGKYDQVQKAFDDLKKDE